MLNLVQRKHHKIPKHFYQVFGIISSDIPNSISSLSLLC
ncbi:hypothetical protein EJK51_0439 [Moraxella catarrhalis]|uniref:Uncharacterized protein n=1 Tax=Moraxella catarrhalis TaxID=480 RepID=A0A3S9QFS6_MORCA|nr:hypothetical protein MCR_0411 [Moraxella catarrhalis BBH18]AZQ87481.1 hypothetical protein EJK52_0440 [Moraxella catarrhalis]AZQ90718.1 hypothetical protein EJK51_0439 [Moraxella catarrhalis]AZQ93544.1 hypothetical protein EJK53_0434 [Moraxella catarrhalis]